MSLVDSEENPEHKKLVKSLIDYFTKQGFKITCSSHEGYCKCPDIEGCTPDVRATSFELNVIGEAKLCDDLDSEMTKKQFSVFSMREMATGSLQSWPVPFYIAISKGCEDKLESTLKELGIDRKPHIHRLCRIRGRMVEYMDYYLNYYVIGCAHGCHYCWSRRLQEIPYEEWVRPKLKAIDGLDEQLKSWKSKVHRIYLCNNTDAYQPIARATTREVVKKLIHHDIVFSILTKSHAVLGDLDLFKAYPKCSIGLSITTDDDGQRREWEPHSSSISDRIDTVRKLKEAGVKTWVSLNPILPGSSPEKILLELKDHVDWWVFGQMNYYDIDHAWYREKGRLLMDLAEKEHLDFYVLEDLRKTMGLPPLTLASSRARIPLNP